MYRTVYRFLSKRVCFILDQNMFVYSTNAVRLIVKKQVLKHIFCYMFRQCQRGLTIQPGRANRGHRQTAPVIRLICNEGRQFLVHPHF